MTLIVLNTQYTKLIRKMTVMGVGLLLGAVSLLSLTCWSAEATGFNWRPPEADNSIPALQGAAAITYLKEHKVYDSLREALHAARAQRADNSVLTQNFIDEQKLIASDGALGDQFGHSVAISGTTVVVGAPDTISAHSERGAAYVFNRQGGGWVEEQKLTPSDGANENQFGWSVAVSGSTIVVGTFLDDFGNTDDQGAVYVFNRQGGSWVETQKLTASDGGESDQLGFSVAVSGSTIVAGAVGVSGNSFRGAAYVFNRQGGSWVEAQKLTASDGSTGDVFGFSVAISGSTVVVGAFADNTFQGSAYVFNRQGGDWVETQKLTASDASTFDLFGFSVAISGSTIVVSARADTIGTNVDQGSVYVFNRQRGSWVETQKLTASDGGASDEFGQSIAISGSTIVVGAISDNTFQGSAYVFNRQGGDWVEELKLTASDGAAGDFFGFSVAISGSIIVVSAPGDDIDSNIEQGSAYVFKP